MKDADFNFGWYSPEPDIITSAPPISSEVIIFETDYSEMADISRTIALSFSAKEADITLKTGQKLVFRIKK